MINFGFFTRTVIYLLLISMNTFSQNGTFSENSAKSFINYLLTRNDSIRQFIQPEVLALSERLGVTYKDVWNKVLISNDIDDQLIGQTASGIASIQHQITGLEDGYSLLTLTFSGNTIVREYYFRGNFLVSAASYFARKWKQIESSYFIFKISDPATFNSPSIKKLDNFIDSMMVKLSFSPEQLELLKKNKIYYFLCATGDEIKALTGFTTMGMYFLPYDYVITTYSCHFHELLHLLINFKLQVNALYTHPFFQEGFAVALGGRGGKEPGVILDMGAFLETSGMLDYKDLLSREQFQAQDASMSYSLSGLYNRFLIETTGMENYLSLYRKYSTGAATIANMIIDSLDLPSATEWAQYVAAYQKEPDISLPKDIAFSNQPPSGNYRITDAGRSCLIELKDTVLLKIDTGRTSAASKQFGELFPGRNYMGEKYAIIPSTDEISIYNLYTGNLIAKYVSAFTAEQKHVPKVNFYYCFFVKKTVFDKGDHIETLNP